MTRTGKVARLPLVIRNILAQRLRDGATGKSLVEWLNHLPEVQATMAAQFSGRPVTEQNLSEWKQGGYLDWLRNQESLEWAACLREQEIELAATGCGEMALSEGTSSLMTLALGRMLRETMANPPDNAQDRQDLLALARELSRLRRADQHATLVRIKVDERADFVRIRQQARARTETKQDPAHSAFNNSSQAALKHAV